MDTPTRVPYDPEFRARAVELVRTRGLPRAQVARDLGINPEPPRLWGTQAAIDTGQRGGLQHCGGLQLPLPVRHQLRHLDLTAVHLDFDLLDRWRGGLGFDCRWR